MRRRERISFRKNTNFEWKENRMQGGENFDAEMKAKLLEMMAWFHDFCVENNIRYYVIDGTMLGAARHQGFIPWDDDIDVGVPRADYERLAKLLGEKTDSRYVFETPYSEAKDFIYTYSKLYDRTTTLIEHAKVDIVRGIFLDVFPLDGIGNNLEEAKKNFKKVNRLFSLYMSRVIAVRPGRKFYKNAAVRLTQLVPNFIINDKSLQLKVDEACREHDYDEYKLVGNLLGTWRFRDVIEKSIMGNPTPYKFENITIFGVENYDAYLTHLYGEWRKLPPIDKQVSQHEFIECNLNQAYLKG